MNDGRFEFGKKIGGGSFGKIYYGHDKKRSDGSESVAIKIELSSNKVRQLEYEAKLYKVLGSAPGVPTTYWYGSEQRCNIMVMDLLGPSLQDLFSFVGHYFSLKTVLQLGSQILSVLEYVHDKSFIHRDLKPANILVGRGASISQVHIIDWGLAKRFRKADVHIQFAHKSRRGLIGNARFGSLNAHRGVELSRRDDIEAVCYMLVYFLKGSLPWQTLDPPADTREEKNTRIGLMKEEIKIETLCSGLPSAISTLLILTKCMEFDEAPRYELMRKVISRCAVEEGIVLDHEFDWTHRREEGEEVDFASEDGRSCNMSQVSMDSVPAPDDVLGGAGARGPLSRASNNNARDGALVRAMESAGITRGAVWNSANKGIQRDGKDSKEEARSSGGYPEGRPEDPMPEQERQPAEEGKS